MNLKARGTGSSPRVGYIGTTERGQWSFPKQQKQDAGPRSRDRSSPTCQQEAAETAEHGSGGRELTCKGGTRHLRGREVPKESEVKVVQGVHEAQGHTGKCVVDTTQGVEDG